MLQFVHQKNIEFESELQKWYSRSMRRRIATKKRTTPDGTVPMDAALKFLGARARTVREVERRLDELQFGEVEIMETVQRLEELNLLDDRAYARDFIATRLATKPVSRAHLSAQLYQHEVPRDIIDEALSAVPDETELASARGVAEKYLRQLAAEPDETRRERTMQRMLARGYSYDTARAAMEECAAEEIAAENEDA